MQGEGEASCQTMTNTVACSEQGFVDRRAKPIAVEPPPTPPPPPIRARGAPRGGDMVLPVTARRRPPAVPPSPPAAADDDLVDDMLELDPVSQNERNDVIWQRRVDGGCGRSARDGGERRSRGHRRDGQRRQGVRNSAVHPAQGGNGCQQCRHVDETARPPPPNHHHHHLHVASPDFVRLKPVPSRTDNDYVEEPSSVPDHHRQRRSPPVEPLRLSDLRPLTTETTADPLPLKSSKDVAGSSTSLRAAVTDDVGVRCKRCGGCRCAACLRTVDVCTCRAWAAGSRHTSTLRTAVRDCFCPCWAWALSACRHHCTYSPDVCRCRVDEL